MSRYMENQLKHTSQIFYVYTYIYSTILTVNTKDYRTFVLNLDVRIKRILPVLFLYIKSKAVVKSHNCIEPLECPVNMNRRGREPILLDPSHSWTQNALTVLPSTALITHTLQKI